MRRIVVELTEEEVDEITSCLACHKGDRGVSGDDWSVVDGVIARLDTALELAHPDATE